MSLADKMIDSHGVPVTHESVANFSPNDVGLDSSLSNQLSVIFDAWKHCIELRQKYLASSLQLPGDNPKDNDNWIIYPPPPDPSYKPTNGEIVAQKDIKSDMETFDFNNCVIPPAHHVSFFNLVRLLIRS